MIYIHSTYPLFNDPLIDRMFTNTNSELTQLYSELLVLDSGVRSEDLLKDYGIDFRSIQRDTIKEKYNIVFTDNIDDFNKKGIHIFTHQFYMNTLSNKWLDNLLSKDLSDRYFYFISQSMEHLHINNNIAHLVKCVVDNPNFIIYGNTIPVSNIRYNLAYTLTHHSLYSHFICKDIFSKLKKEYRFVYGSRNSTHLPRNYLFRKLVELNNSNIFLPIRTTYLNILKLLKRHVGDIDIRIDREPNLSIKNNFKEIQNYLNNATYTHPDFLYPTNITKHNDTTKFVEVTGVSDIDLFLEGSPYISMLDVMDSPTSHTKSHISSFTLGALIVGKPFIVCCQMQYQFLKYFEFDNYSDIIGIDYDLMYSNQTNSQELSYLDEITKKIEEICKLPNDEYAIFLLKLNERANNNKQILLDKFNCNIIDEILIDYNHLFNL